MRVTISPYDLTHRAPGALAALLITDAAATIVPIARAWTAEDPDAAIAESPALGRMLETWRWATPLWSAGILGPTDAAGHAGLALVAEAADAIGDSALNPMLARVAPRQNIADRGRMAENLCMDIVRGGRNPALSVSVASALERFAAESGWPVVLCPTGSVVGGIEHKLATPIAGVDVPAPIAATGEGLLMLREQMAPELESLRAALAETSAAARSGAAPSDLTELERSALGPAGAALCDAAASFLPERSRGRSADWSLVRMTVSALPADAMVRAAEIAATQLVGAPSRDIGTTTSTKTLTRSGALAMVVRHLPWDLAPAASRG